MASTMTRRPLPALVGLLALLVLTGIVWWRVANRDSESAAKPRPTATPTTCTSAPAPVAPPTVVPRSVTVAVVNSTERFGIATKARQALVSDGFRSAGKAGNLAADVSVSAQIRYARSSRTGSAGARLLQYYFPGSTLAAQDSSSDTVTVVLGDAYKSVASAASVKAELARASTASPPTSSAGC